MIKVDLLLKLVELKKLEIDDYKNDLYTLIKIVANLETELKEQQEIVNEFVRDCINNENYNSSAVNMINGRAYLQNLNVKNSDIEKSKLNAEKQQDSAFESLKEAALELKKLTKIIEKTRKKELEDANRKALSIDDTLELYRHNNKA